MNFMCVCLYMCAYLLIFLKKKQWNHKPNFIRNIIYGEGWEWDEGDRDGSDTPAKVLYNSFHF